VEEAGGSEYIGADFSRSRHPIKDENEGIIADEIQFSICYLAKDHRWAVLNIAQEYSQITLNRT
jgi:hypothetical protein